MVAAGPLQLDLGSGRVVVVQNYCSETHCRTVCYYPEGIEIEKDIRSDLTVTFAMLIRSKPSSEESDSISDRILKNKKN